MPVWGDTRIAEIWASNHLRRAVATLRAPCKDASTLPRITMAASPKNLAVERGKLVVIAAMSLLWITPTIGFWSATFRPLRPFDYPQEDLAPSLSWFFAGLAVCFIPCALPRAYYYCWEGRRGIRAYELLGIRTFKRYATNGDLINRLARRSDPLYRIVRDRATALTFADGTRTGERHHLVLLLIGLLTASFAARIGWYGWAFALSASNILFNFYPVLLQRYDRYRIMRVSPRWGIG
jgi:hypothetical protein